MRKRLRSNPVSDTKHAGGAETVCRVSGFLEADEFGVIVSRLDRMDVSCLDLLFPPVWCEVRLA